MCHVTYALPDCGCEYAVKGVCAEAMTAGRPCDDIEEINVYECPCVYCGPGDDPRLQRFLERAIRPPGPWGSRAGRGNQTQGEGDQAVQPLPQGRQGQAEDDREDDAEAPRRERSEDREDGGERNAGGGDDGPRRGCCCCRNNQRRHEDYQRHVQDSHMFFDMPLGHGMFRSQTTVEGDGRRRRRHRRSRGVVINNDGNPFYGDGGQGEYGFW